MARIRDIRLIPLAFQMPQIKAYGMARRLVASRGATLVEVETEDGVVGIGEAWGCEGGGRLRPLSTPFPTRKPPKATPFASGWGEGA